MRWLLLWQLVLIESIFFLLRANGQVNVRTTVKSSNQNINANINNNSNNNKVVQTQRPSAAWTNARTNAAATRQSNLSEVVYPVRRYIESYFLIDAAAVELFRQRGVSASRLLSTIDELVDLTNALLLDVGMWLTLVDVEISGNGKPWPVNYTFTSWNNSVGFYGYAALRSLGEYRINRLLKQRQLSVDHVHLITGHWLVVQNQSIVGMGIQNSICSNMSATIVSLPKIFVGNSFDLLYDLEVLAIALAHEIGHTLDLQHDVPSRSIDSTRLSMARGSGSRSIGKHVAARGSTCECSDTAQCVMWPNLGHQDYNSVVWTDCSRSHLQLSGTVYPRDLCLSNRPAHIVRGGSKCGDWVVDRDRGEQCDCGPAAVCNATASSHCCVASTCQLQNAAQCGAGTCCNLSTCSFTNAEAELPCREAVDECDLPELCDGSSASCPEDVWKADGTLCAGNTGYCYRGKCRSVQGQCQALLGPSMHAQRLAIDDPIQSLCFRYAHCNYLSSEVVPTIVQNDYKKSTKSSWDFDCIFAGLNYSYRAYGCTYLACESNQVAEKCSSQNSLSSFVNIETLDAFDLANYNYDNDHCCHRPVKGPDFSLASLITKRDLRLIEDGTKCGVGMMCLKQQCRSIDSLAKGNFIKPCPQECPTGLVCNNQGKCQVDKTPLTTTPPATSPPHLPDIGNVDASNLIPTIVGLVVGVLFVAAGTATAVVCLSKRGYVDLKRRRFTRARSTATPLQSQSQTSNRQSEFERVKYSISSPKLNTTSVRINPQWVTVSDLIEHEYNVQFCSFLKPPEEKTYENCI